VAILIARLADVYPVVGTKPQDTACGVLECGVMAQSALTSGICALWRKKQVRMGQLKGKFNSNCRRQDKAESRQSKTHQLDREAKGPNDKKSVGLRSLSRRS